MRINIMVWETYGWIAGTRSFLEEFQKSIAEISHQGMEQLDEIAKTLNWDYERYIEERQEIESTVEHWLPLALKYSTIALTYMIVETRLHSLAMAIEKRPEVNIKLSEIKGKGIKKVRLFIKKAIKYDISTDSSWNDLCNLATLRNIILHNLGRQGEKAGEVKTMMNKYRGEISLSGHRKNIDSDIIIDFALCYRFLNIIEGFFQRIYEACGYQNKIFVTVQ